MIRAYTGQKAMNSVASIIVPERVGRQFLRLYNASSPVFIGSATVQASNGFLVGSCMTIVLPFVEEAVYGICNGVDISTISFLDEAP